MREKWTFAGVPQFVEVLGRQTIVEKPDHSEYRYWLDGYYPWWGRVIPHYKTWSGRTETEVVRSYTNMLDEDGNIDVKIRVRK